MQADNKALQDLVGDTLLKVNGDKIDQVDFNTFNGKIASAKFVCFYFGAHWAPPSRLFTENLKSKVYDEVNKDGCAVEVIFVSDDRKEDHFERNFKKMPWYSVPFTQEQRIQTLKSKFSVIELPTLVVLDKNGKIVSHEGRQDVAKGVQALKDWEAKLQES